MTLTFETHLTSFTYLFNISTNFEAYGCNSFQIICNFQFAHAKAHVTKFDLGVK